MSARSWVRWHAIPFCWCNVSAISAVSAHVIHIQNILCCRKTQNNSAPDGSDSDKVPGTKRMTGEESWTKIKACQLGTTSKRVRGVYCRTWQGRDLVLSTVNMNRMIVSLVVSKLEKL